MENLWKCFCYLIIIGILSFFIGRIIPKKWFKHDSFPYRCFEFENKGKIYDKFKVRQWQNKVPDMSRIFPKIMPAKNLSGNYKDRLFRMLQETCVAELIHVLLCFSGLYCLLLWPGAGGVVITLLYIVFFNLPFIIIQRYNRPRLARLYSRLRQDEKTAS